MYDTHSNAMTVAPWKTAVGLNAFMSAMQKYDTVYPDWEVLDFISRRGFDGVELAPDWPLGGYPAANEPKRGFRGWMMVDVWAIPDVYDAFDKGLASIQAFVASR